MKKLLYASLLLAASLAGCRHDSDAPAPSDELAGSWRLTGMECFCAYDPKIVEILTLGSDYQFRLTRDGRLASQGTFVITQGSACAGGPVEPYLQLTAANGAYAPSGVYGIQSNTLTIRQCVELDAPAYTYKRQ